MGGIKGQNVEETAFLPSRLPGPVPASGSSALDASSILGPLILQRQFNYLNTQIINIHLYTALFFQ
jgi:hypothetical protein